MKLSRFTSVLAAFMFLSIFGKAQDYPLTDNHRLKMRETKFLIRGKILSDIFEQKNDGKLEYLKYLMKVEDVILGDSSLKGDTVTVSYTREYWNFESMHRFKVRPAFEIGTDAIILGKNFCKEEVLFEEAITLNTSFPNSDGKIYFRKEIRGFVKDRRGFNSEEELFNVLKKEGRLPIPDRYFFGKKRDYPALQNHFSGTLIDPLKALILLCDHAIGIFQLHDTGLIKRIGKIILKIFRKE